MNRENIVESIRRFFEKDLLKRSKIEQLSNNDNVIAAGVVDSLGIIKVISFLEDTFSVVIEDSDLVMENFETIESIATFVEDRRNQN